jgi:opacity protein-like surface antigen
MKRFVFLATMAISIGLTSAAAQAARHGIGLDIIRLVDKNQDNGMANIHGQIGLTGDTAIALGYASGDNLVIIEAGIKYYFSRYFDGAFLQFGIGYYDHDSNGDDFGFVAGLGYEQHLNDFLAVSWAIKMAAQVDEDIIGYPETPVFQPAMSVMITF